MAAPPVCSVDATGIHRPTYAECRAYYEDGYRGIYGQDVVLTPDTQDGQWLKIQADALHAANGAMVAVYNAFGPSTAQGVGLGRSVKLNGLARLVASFSTADVRIVGQAFTVIANGLISDADGTEWTLPTFVQIPLEGEIEVVATCTESGAVRAPADTLTGIATPTPGWQTVTNPADAIPGEPIETDATLRQRQAVSTLNPSTTLMAGFVGSIAALPNVARVRGYENATTVSDTNGLPPASFALVVEGGDPDAIAAVIAAKKPPGRPAIGTASGRYTDRAGISYRIPFFRTRLVPVTYVATIRPLPGYTADIDTVIAARLAAYTEALGIGTPVKRARAFVPAQLMGAQAATFDLLDLALARDGQAPDVRDLAIGFDERPSCEAAFIRVVKTP